MPGMLENTDRYFKKSALLIENWNERISIVEEVNEAPLSYDRKIVLAQCLENTQSAISMLEATDTADIGQFKHYALDLVTAIVPNLVANDLVSIQPIDNEVGVINYIRYLYGSTKGSATSGNEFASGLLYTGSDPYYSSQHVVGEGLTIAGDKKQVTGTLSWRKVIAGTVSIPMEVKVDAGATVAIVVSDDGAGKLIAKTVAGVDVTSTYLDATTSVVDYTTGALTVDLKTVADPASQVTCESVAVTAEYDYDQKSVGDGAIGTNQLKVPEVQIKIESMPVIVQSRKLKALYAFDAAFKLQKEYGTDINALLNTQIAAEIAHEIDGELMDDLFLGAGLTGEAWSDKVPDGISLKDHYQSFQKTLVANSNKIFGATKRAVGNFMIVGLNVATVIEVMPGFVSANQKNVVGPHVMGNIGNFVVVKNPYYADDTYLIGYKGPSLFDAGFFYCPYMPVITTQLIMLDDFVGRKGWATSYAKKMVQNKLYVKGSITHA